MIEIFRDLNPIWQALLAGIFTWLLTALGAATIFLPFKMGEKFLNLMLGFAAGVMIAASFWSLLQPSLELAAELGQLVWLPVAIGFLTGGFSLALIDKILPHLHPELSKPEGPPSRIRRTILLVLAITIHNIPEGFAVGVAFAAVATGTDSTSLPAALSLAMGIGLQNFPEGIAVSLPLFREIRSRGKAFFYGQLSGLVEPITAMVGAFLVLQVQPLLPFFLAFAAGAMIFVVVEEVIPEAERNESSDIATVGVLVGFTLMMVLDVALK